MYFNKRNSLASVDRVRPGGRRRYNQILMRGGNNLATVQVWRFKTFFAVVILFCLTTVYLFFLSNVFFIKIKEITPTKYVSTDAVLTRVRECFSRRKFIFFKNNNYFIFSTDELKQELINNFRFTEVEIFKFWPNEISISLVEDESFAIFASSPDSDNFLLLDYQGGVVNSFAKNDVPTDLPKLFFENNSRLLVREDISPNVLKLVIDSWRVARQTNLFKISEYRFGGAGELTALTDRGFFIIFDIENDANQQISNLEIMLSDFQKSNTLPSEYLNLTFGEKIFYK